MTPLLFLGVAAAGGVGAGLRYCVELAAARVFGDRLPWGILGVNVTGAFVLGLLSAGLADATGLWLLGTGLLGGYTTFSSVAVTTVLLLRDGRAKDGIGYAIITFLCSVLLAFTGFGLGGLLA